MSFPDVVRRCLTEKYADFSGRATRTEFWYWALFYFIVQAVTSILDSAFHTRNSRGGGLITFIADLALLLPFLAVSARRLHDTGRSGWWTVLWFIPLLIPQIILIVFWAQDSHGENQYGPGPLGAAGYGSVGYGQGYGQGWSGYGPPPSEDQRYGAPTQGDYGTPSYGPPPSRSEPGYGPAPTQPGYGPPPSDQPYGAPPAQPGYGTPPSQPGYGTPPSSGQGYAPPEPRPEDEPPTTPQPRP